MEVKLRLKLNKRELTLVVILGIVLSSVVYYKYIIVSQKTVIASAIIKRDKKRNELTKFRTDMASKQKLKDELIKFQKKLDSESKSYFLTLDQEEIILLLNDFAKETSIRVEAINFEEPKVEVLAGDEKGEKNAKLDELKEKKENYDKTNVTEKENSEKDESDSLDVYTVNLEYESSYASLLELLKLITSYEKRIMIKDININKDEIENQNIKGKIALDFYVIGKILGEDGPLYAWGANLAGTLDDPFSKFTGYVPKKDESNVLKDSDGAINENSSLGAKILGASNVENNEDKDNLNPKGKSSEISVPSNSNNSKKPKNSKKSEGVSSNESNKTPANSSGSGNSGNIKKPVNTPKKPINTQKPDNKPKDIFKELFAFEEMKSLSFESDDKNVKTAMNLNKDKKTQGKSSLSLEYDFVEKREYNSVYLSFKNRLEIKEQPKSLSISVEPIEKNNCTLGVVVKDREGIEYRLPLTNNLDWDGWQTLMTTVPIDINYPATVDRVYIESRGHYVKLTGDLLMDDLKLIYVHQ